MNHITLQKAVELARTVKMSEWVGSQVQAVCNAAIEWHIAQQAALQHEPENEPAVSLAAQAAPTKEQT